MASRKKNGRAQKREEQFLSHNRKAGSSARGKALRHKQNRRTRNAMSQNIIRSYVPHVFKQ